MRKAFKFSMFLNTVKRDTSGTAAVEFAMLAPIFILLLLGMVAYGIYFGASHSIEQISADAARIAIAGLTPSERKTLVAAYIARNGAGYAFVNPEKLTVDAADSTLDSNQFVVSVSYDASDLPIWGLFRDLSMPGMTIKRQSTIRLGGF